MPFGPWILCALALIRSARSLLHAQGQLAESLYGVNVQQGGRFFFFNGVGRRLYGQDAADFVVDAHHADQDGFRRNGVVYLLWVNMPRTRPVSASRLQSRPVPAALQC